MKAVFIDNSFWVALTWEKDPLFNRARALLPLFSQCHMVTTDEVLDEFLTYFSNKGAIFRKLAVQTVKDLMQYGAVEIIPQSRDSFLKGLQLYEQRPDKGYSLTDCISMQTMKALQITDVLTYDKHFRQEGFRTLLNLD